MIFLNTYWTWEYFFMLVFVFITLFALCIRWLGLRYPYFNFFGSMFWAALGTLFFHNVW